MTEVEKLAVEKIQLGVDLINQLDAMKHVTGVKKTQNKISTEIASIRKVSPIKNANIHETKCYLFQED